MCCTLRYRGVCRASGIGGAGGSETVKCGRERGGRQGISVQEWARLGSV